MKRKTYKHRSLSSQSVLHVRVMSPRIAWFGFLKLVGMFIKIACVLAVLGGAGWGVWRGINYAFYTNPDFRLKIIDLNTNPVIDEVGVATAAGIDLTAPPSLFDIDVKEVCQKLKALPAISDAHVERHLPGTLLVRVTARTAQAWIRCPAAGLTETRHAGCLLVDSDGIAYPCPASQGESAVALPIFELPASKEHPITPGKKIQLTELQNCFNLLESARQADADASHWIESIRQVNEWSLCLLTRQGTKATFGLGDHTRQIESLRAALDHAGEKGYLIDTINLIPKNNIPITLRDGGSPPKAVPVSTSAPSTGSENRRNRDLNHLLNRN